MSNKTQETKSSFFSSIYSGLKDTILGTPERFSESLKECKEELLGAEYDTGVLQAPVETCKEIVDNVYDLAWGNLKTYLDNERVSFWNFLQMQVVDTFILGVNIAFTLPTTILRIPYAVAKSSAYVLMRTVGVPRTAADIAAAIVTTTTAIAAIPTALAAAGAYLSTTVSGFFGSTTVAAPAGWKAIALTAIKAAGMYSLVLAHIVRGLNVVAAVLNAADALFGGMLKTDKAASAAAAAAASFGEGFGPVPTC